MSFCHHCAGQRFDRARVLRVLRESRRRLQREHASRSAHALTAAIEEIRKMEIPHLELELDEVTDGEIIH